MGTSEECAVPRLKREECTRTKHDSVFSEWKILVGPSDWEDHSLGKEGATRYRVHNLPTSSGSGVYELGIAVPHTGLGREVGKLDPHGMVVVYLGQADNVRTRLQSYGRSGAHLCNSYSTGQQKNGPCLFDEIFSKGYSIVFRWAPMKNKGDAKKTEAQLLDRFDYAWNKGSNGPRRHCDVLQKLGKLASRTTWIPNIARKLQILNQKPVGIRINARKPLLLQNESSTCTEEESNSLLSQVFRFSRSRPRLIFVKPQVGDEDFIPTCGVTLDDGTPCRRPPVPGRKRCEEHKGRRICGSISYSVTDGRSSYVHDVVLDSSSRNDQEYDTCGITLDDGTSCRRPSVPGRKRCEEHRGRRICVVLDSSSCNDQDYDPCGIILEDGTPCRRSPVPGRKRCEEHKGRRICGSISNSVMYGKSSYEHGAVFDSSSRNDQAYDTCGVDLGSGIYCRTQPIAGRKRCEEHKGMRVNGLVSRLAAEDKPHVSDSGAEFSTSNDWKYDCNSSLLSKYGRSQPQVVSHRSAVDNDFSNMCGATLLDGSLCRRQPAEGRKRCWQHKGMRADSSFSGFDSGSPLLCGATLRNGSVCTRAPAHGRKRCEQHKGMRVSTSYYFLEENGETSELGVLYEDLLHRPFKMML